MHSNIFAVSNSSAASIPFGIGGASSCASPPPLPANIAPIGNPAYICAIAIIDPAYPIIAAFVNREYMFWHHIDRAASAAPIETPSQRDDCPIHITKPPASFRAVQVAIRAVQYESGATILAVGNALFFRPGEFVSAIGIPIFAEPIARGIFNAYRANIVSRRKCQAFVYFIAQTATPAPPPQPGHLDFCPLSQSRAAMENFAPYYPNIWKFTLHDIIKSRRAGNNTVTKPLRDSPLAIRAPIPQREALSSSQHRRREYSPPDIRARRLTLGDHLAAARKPLPVFSILRRAPKKEPSPVSGDPPSINGVPRE
ncbi:MAG: hypothetical protein M0R66_07750 [Candidatus Omnitrophica bacterium]|nr:hypothetical protein [Candidatus Omnitrophota bacterium]